MKRFILSLLFLSLSRLCFAANKCYYPNGLEAEDHPCDPNAKQSVCCSGGLGTLYLLFPGADTGGTDLISCSNITNSDTSYCCDHNTNCCNSGVGRFNVLPSDPEVWATWNRKATRYDVVGTMFSGQSTTETASATTEVTSSTTSASSTTTSDASIPSSSVSNTPEPSETPAGLSTGAKAGIGAGVGVGAIMAVAVKYLFWKMRRNEKTAKQGEQQPPSNNNPMTDAWQNSQYVYTSKGYQYQPQPPQELSGTPLQGYNGPAELPGHN
ncbi:hypothetical protein FGADI_13087 [Fusarium gaditjirri]|uniref:Mid2 domain-containing protein n=1 Tax=Fusarium gaditjirri TaxID=282569 RepID=A0A8H4SQW2_9HYPO|nr:hypothetical protein FGADI_13087 [Fusarium gaditjirri]